MKLQLLTNIIFLLTSLFLTSSSETSDSLRDSIGTPATKCWGRSSCSERWILCNKNWGCAYDCFGCPVCGENDQLDISTVIEDINEPKSCYGAENCKGRKIMCPPKTQCIYSHIGCPMCASFGSLKCLGQ
jgi:hypothetical protein